MALNSLKVIEHCLDAGIQRVETHSEFPEFATTAANELKMEQIMRALVFLTGTMLISGCSVFFPSRADHSCESASHALRVHDSRIDAARASGTMGFTANLASRGYQSYHCVTTSGNQIACSTIESGIAAQNSSRVDRLLRERNAIESRVARACQI